MSFERYDESLLATIHNAWTIHGYYRLLLNMASLRLPYEKNDPELNAKICEKILTSLQKNADPLITDGRYQNALHYLLAYGTAEQTNRLFKQIPQDILANMCTPNLLGISPLDLLATRMGFLHNKDIPAWEAIKIFILDMTYPQKKSKETLHEKTRYSLIVGELQESSQIIYASLWPTQKNLLMAREIIQNLFQHQQGFCVELLEHNSATLPQDWDNALSENRSNEKDLRGKEIKITMASFISPSVCKKILLTLWVTLEKNGLDLGYIKPLGDNIEEYPCAQNILSPFTCVDALPIEFSFTVSDMILHDLHFFHEKSILRMRIYFESSHTTHVSGPLAYFSKYLKRRRPEWSFSVEENLLKAVETGLHPIVKKDNDFNENFMKKFSDFMHESPWQIQLEEAASKILDTLVLKQKSYMNASSQEERRILLYEICFYLNTLDAQGGKLTSHQRKSLYTFRLELVKMLHYNSYDGKIKNENASLVSPIPSDKKILQETYLKHLQSMRFQTMIGITDISDTLKDAITLLRENPYIDPTRLSKNSNNILHFIMIYNHTGLLNDLASAITTSHLHKLMSQKNEYDDTPLAVAHRKGDIPSLLCALHLVFLSRKTFDKNIHGITLLQRTFSHILIFYKNEKAKTNSFNKAVIQRAKARGLDLPSSELVLTELEKKLESIINSFPLTQIQNPTLNCLLLGLQGASTLFPHGGNSSMERPWYLLYLAVSLLVKSSLVKNNHPKQVICTLEDCEKFLSWAKEALGFNEHRELHGILRQSFWNVVSETASSSKHLGDTTSGSYVENFIRVCQLERERLQDKTKSNLQELSKPSPVSQPLCLV